VLSQRKNTCATWLLSQLIKIVLQACIVDRAGVSFPVLDRHWIALIDSCVKRPLIDCMNKMYSKHVGPMRVYVSGIATQLVKPIGLKVDFLHSLRVLHIQRRRMKYLWNSRTTIAPFDNQPAGLLYRPEQMSFKYVFLLKWLVSHIQH